jgi:trigger factor
LKRKIETRLKEQALAALRGKAELAVPRSLVELESQNMAGRMAEEMRRQGMKAEDIKLAPKCFATTLPSALRLGLVLAEVVRAHGLTAKPEQVKALVKESAQTYEQPDAVVRWHYEKAGTVERIRGARRRTHCRRMGARARKGHRQADKLRRPDGARAAMAPGRSEFDQPRGNVAHTR